MIDTGVFSARKALFHTFGCKLNFAETSTVATLLAERGILRASHGETPDIIVVNTCSVTQLADKKCRQAIRGFARRYPQAAIIVTGCYAQRKPEEVGALPGVAVIAGNDRKERIGEYLDRWLETQAPVTDVIPTRDIRSFTPSCSRGDRTRWMLKVQDGCDYFCTYCTIPMARGRSRSGSIDDLVAQARSAAAEGAREIVITGVNIGDFGKGRSDTFLDLIRELDNVDGIERYRISSIEPNLLTDEIIRFVASSRRFMPHFHIPLQSGSDEVLRLMHRHYDTRLFRERIETIRSLMPHAFIGVDLIVGPRGETVERFEESRLFVESLPISRLHVFPYSERPGTRALEIKPVVDPGERHRRARTMIALSEDKLTRFAAEFAGTIRPVLVEHAVNKDGAMHGFTDNYLKCVLTTAAEPNSIIACRLESLDTVDTDDEPALFRAVPVNDTNMPS